MACQIIDQHMLSFPTGAFEHMKSSQNDPPESRAAGVVEFRPEDS